VALARLGRTSIWVSRLTDNPLGADRQSRPRGWRGHFARRLTKDDRVGLYFLEFGPPRASSVLYDRKDAAIAHVKPACYTGPKPSPGRAGFM